VSLEFGYCLRLMRPDDPAEEESLDRQIEGLYRSLSPKLLAVLVPLLGPSRFDLAEDVLQEAFASAMMRWRDGLPDNPEGWLVQTAKNRAIDHLRAQIRRPGQPVDDQTAVPELVAEQAFDDGDTRDDQLCMIFMCCHRDLEPKYRIPLILRTLCGFSLAAVSRALILPLSTIKKRLYRARQRLKGYHFSIPRADQMDRAMDSVHTVMYLLFNEGFHSSDAQRALRPELCRDALALVRLLIEDTRVVNRDTVALFALMHFHLARLEAKLDDQGHPIPIDLQDRLRWNRTWIERGNVWLGSIDAYRPGSSGRFEWEARIAREHCLAVEFGATNWKEIENHYQHLAVLTQSPMVKLNYAIALGYAGKVEQAIDLVEQLSSLKALVNTHHSQAVLAHLYAMSGDRERALEYAAHAASRGGTPHEHRVMMQQLERLLQGD